MANRKSKWYDDDNFDNGFSDEELDDYWGEEDEEYGDEGNYNTERAPSKNESKPVRAFWGFLCIWKVHENSLSIDQ